MSASDWTQMSTCGQWTSLSDEPMDIPVVAALLLFPGANQRTPCGSVLAAVLRADDAFRLKLAE